jgi:hypothetical protein
VKVSDVSTSWTMWLTKNNSPLNSFHRSTLLTILCPIGLQSWNHWKAARYH